MEKERAQNIVNIVMDELHEFKYLDIEIKVVTYSDEYKKKKFSAANAQWKANGKDENGNVKLRYLIELCHNLDEFMKSRKSRRLMVERNRHRFKNFIDSMDIPMSDEVEFLFMILHELGHVKLIETYRFYGRYEAFRHAGRIFMSTIKMSLTNDVIDKHYVDTGVHLGYLIDPIEVNADNFALLNLPRVWKRLNKDYAMWN